MMPDSSDWSHLIGRTIQVSLDGRHIRDGQVEEVANDSSMMWLRFDGVHRRQLLLKDDGYEILPLEENAVLPAAQNRRSEQNDIPRWPTAR